MTIQMKAIEQNFPAETVLIFRQNMQELFSQLGTHHSELGGEKQAAKNNSKHMSCGLSLTHLLLPLLSTAWRERSKHGTTFRSLSS